MDRRALALGLLALAACTAPQPCPNPLHECNGQCVDIESDRRHCGGCNAACDVGKVCVGQVCTPDISGPCPTRINGAFVTLGHCGTAVKVWVVANGFVDAALARVGAAPDPSFVPSLAILANPDCDAQWSWHVDPRNATTREVASIDPAFLCTRCPAEIQPAEPNLPPTTRAWCPVDASVLAVDDRRP